MDKPIIKSLTDLDWYKITMLAFVWGHRNTFSKNKVKYAFTNRTKRVNLPNIIPENQLREQIEHVRTLRFNEDELRYISTNLLSTGITFKNNSYEEFFTFLRDLQLPEVNIEKRENDFLIETEDNWENAILWETICLSIVNELFYINLMKNQGTTTSHYFASGEGRLVEKIEKLKQHPLLKIIEFGTRRRFSGDWQERVLQLLLNEISNQVTGTSNVFLAKKLGIKPIGTMAHELFMVWTALMRSEFADSDDAIRSSHNEVIQAWWNMYGKSLSIVLTDTYGTDFFFRDMTPRQAAQWKGLRQDSGKPKNFGYSSCGANGYYQRNGISSENKIITFSDGLDVDKIINLYLEFRDICVPGFGWGTNLTNDVGFKPISAVMKAVMANGFGTVKLSDNLAKALGSEEDKERFKRIFGYKNIMSQELVY